ncbi:glycosyltransferase family 2 protein [Nitrospina gracilis]|uniref:glycosyltransferase family 2 protein n=1 Tax=Nitrospina gracilis TaxID=35801 RepID=UPI001F2D3DC5|nr:glycosyltransferase [Nitrospina gracilis]MCF8721052.1 glycosyltransferase involved in cell wall biosynthesis [Nitrospina gracilis Nb-211]
MTDKEPQISIIVPTFNRAWCLQETLASVCQQQFKNYELIVVDDASTDDTERLVKSFDSVQYIRLESNQGVSAARNAGLRRARGHYICFLDSDDRWIDTKLERQWEWMQTHPGCPACYTDEIWIRNGVRVNPAKKHRKYSGYIFQHCLPLCIISPSSVMLKREVLSRIGGFDEALPACEDYDLWLRLTFLYPVQFLEEPLIVKYGGHEDQLSARYWGMDRFRVYALEKLLVRQKPQGETRRGVLEMLVEKCGILETGFRNRGKPGEAETFFAAKHHFAALQEENGDASPAFFDPEFFLNVESN